MGCACCKDENRYLDDYYDVHEVLGSGSHSIVYKASKKSESKQKEYYAVKVMEKKDETTEEKIDLEIKILQNSKHPNIVEYYDRFETNSKIVIVLELLTGKELLDRIIAKGYYSELSASAAIKQIVTAVEYLHQQGYIHRDIKPANLVFQSDDEFSPIKLTDFSLAASIDKTINGSINGVMATPCGTPTYVSPEILKRENYDESVDIWSIGVVLYIVLCGYPPFTSNVRSVLYKQICKGEYAYESPFWDDISSSAKSLVDGCLQVDPAKRFTAFDILNHPWIKDPNKLESSNTFDKSHLKRIALFNGRQKLQKTINSIILAIRVKNIIDQQIRKSESPPSKNKLIQEKDNNDNIKKCVNPDVVIYEK